MGGTPDEKEELKSPSVPDLPIQKKVLHAGKGDLPKFADGTKVEQNNKTKVDVFYLVFLTFLGCRSSSILLQSAWMKTPPFLMILESGASPWRLFSGRSSSWNRGKPLSRP